jgi:16S rRNA processing protein RimM
VTLLEVGHVVKGHGLKGEVVVGLVTNVPNRLAPGRRFRTRQTGRIGARPEGTPPPSPPSELVVVSSRPFQAKYLVTFEGIATRLQADALRGVALLAEPEPDDDALFVHELIGAEVIDTIGVSHGRVVAVEANPASDLLVGETGWLVPLRFVVERQGQRIIVDVPAGLFE